MIIAINTLNRHKALVHIQERHVQRAPSKVIDQDVVDVRFLMQPVGDRGRCGLFHDAHYLEGKRGGGREG